MAKKSKNVLHRKVLFEKIEKNIIKWLSDYDNGLIVETASMGGMGDGYELAIQECAIETMRNLENKDVPEDQEEFVKILDEALDNATDKLDKVHGFSGSQVGAAKNIAAVFWKQTPEKGLKKLPEDRLLRMRKNKHGMAELVKDE